MLADSNLLQDLQHYAFSPGPAGHPLCVYGDPTYPLRVHLQTPFRNMILTPQMVNFNKAMSSVRVSVEWLFGDIVEYLKFVDFKKNLKIRLSSRRSLWASLFGIFEVARPRLVHIFPYSV